MKVIYEVRDKVARITLNRPEVMNAMDAEAYEQLSKAWDATCATTRTICVAIITGAGERVLHRGRRPQVAYHRAPPSARTSG